MSQVPLAIEMADDAMEKWRGFAIRENRVVGTAKDVLIVHYKETTGAPCRHSFQAWGKWTCLFTTAPLLFFSDVLFCSPKKERKKGAPRQCGRAYITEGPMRLLL